MKLLLNDQPGFYDEEVTYDDGLYIRIKELPRQYRDGLNSRYTVFCAELCKDLGLDAEKFSLLFDVEQMDADDVAVQQVSDEERVALRKALIAQKKTAEQIDDAVGNMGLSAKAIARKKLAKELRVGLGDKRKEFDKRMEGYTVARISEQLAMSVVAWNIPDAEDKGKIVDLNEENIGKLSVVVRNDLHDRIWNIGQLGAKVKND